MSAPPTESCDPGELVPIPRNPFGLIVRAETLEVASAVDVLIYKLFAMDRKVHALLPAVVSVSASCGPEEEAAVSFQNGVVVPIPTSPVLVSLATSAEAVLNVAIGPVPLCVTARVGIEAVEEAKSPP